MPGRRFAIMTCDLERVSLTNAAGTLQKIPTFSVQVSGLEVAFVKLSDRETDTVVASLNEIRAVLHIDADQLVGLEVRNGDRLRDTTLNQTWTVEQVILVQDRVWECDVRRKIA